MPITLNNSNISVQYDTGSNYIIETVKSDLYVNAPISMTSGTEPKITSPVFTESIQTFIHSGGAENQTTHTFSLGRNTICDILIVGGGGGGGNYGGGGGGGDAIYKTNYTLNGGIYSISVGNGGNGGSGAYNRGINGFSSSITSTNASFISLFAAGGGGGGSYNQTPGTTPIEGSVINDNYSSGGGGGGGAGGISGGNSGGTGNSVSGNGGNNNAQTKGGGGGGAVGNGLNASSSGAGNGGSGLSNSISGTVVTYGGGGGGGTWTGGTAGSGVDGGGNGAVEGSGSFPTAGTANRGGGGGGGGGSSGINNQNGAKGGSGIVIIKLKSLAEPTTEGNPITHKTLNFVYSTTQPNTYTLSFEQGTKVQINNQSAQYLLGNYTVSVGATQSSVLGLSGQTNPYPLTNGSSIAIRYSMTRDVSTLDPIGAQWTYNSSNTSVYHIGNVGIGTKNPEYQLDVRGNIYSSTGGYTQSGLTTWTVLSDRRIKENVVQASYEKCLDNVKNIELYNFNFKDNYVITNDRHQLGFIAQEVQAVYPKAVEVGKMTINAGNAGNAGDIGDANCVIENILTLNTTQIDYTLYGAVKNLIEKIEDIEICVEKLYINTISSNIDNDNDNDIN